ncbi:MAG TPA: nodulation protein NfeD [Anaerolineae bacterium]|nr:nodulation protein NfeD [Anaerolineae bacterium]
MTRIRLDGHGFVMHRRGVLLILTMLLLWNLNNVQAQSGNVLVLDIEGPVTPAMANYFERGIQAGETQNANAVLIQLDTPGGAIDVTLDIVQSFANAEVPIIVYVAPSGAMAASAGSVITLAADAAGMAPDTIIGAASPVGGDGADLPETIKRKEMEALSATMRNLTAVRGDEATDLAVRMITKAAAVNAQEALDAGLIDAIAADTTDLLNQLDGLTVQVSGAEMTLETAEANQQPFNMSLLERILHAVANPIIVGILMAIGIQAIIIEISNPGGWVAGLIGVIMLGLGLYGLGQLPVNYLGLGLVIIAFVLFLAEVMAANHGALAVAGTITLFAGLMVLFNSPGTPAFSRISIPTAVAITGGTALFFLFIMSKAVRAQKKKPITGQQGMIGQTGKVRDTFTSAESSDYYHGYVFVNGELWQARSVEPLQFGDSIVVDSIDELRLDVHKEIKQTNNNGGKV